MSDKYFHYCDDLLANKNFIYSTGEERRDVKYKVHNFISSSSVFSYVVGLSFLCGVLVCISATSESAFLKCLLAFVCCVIVFVGYGVIHTFFDKMGDEVFFSYFLPSKLRFNLMHDRDREQNEIFSEIYDITLQSVRLMYDVPFGKKLSKAELEHLFNNVVKMEELCVQYRELSFYDDLARNAPDDYGLKESIMRKLK